MLPPLPIHCVALDGETATMPVIFEDHYQEPFEYKKKHQEETISSPTRGKQLHGVVVKIYISNRQ